MNRENIIKALECCYMQELEHNENCPECPYTDLYPDCAEYLGKHCFSLIKELTQAHEMLSESYDHLEKTKDDLIAERSRLTEENNFLKEELRNATAEVFMLRERNADLHASCTKLERKCASLNDENERLKGRKGERE